MQTFVLDQLRGSFVRHGLRWSFGGRPLATLAYEEIRALPDSPSNLPTAHGLIVHGLLGQGKNWRSFSQQLARKAAHQSKREWRVFLVDLRNHGNSAKLGDFPAPHTLEAAAGDILHLARNEIRASLDLIAGHSLGGKVVMELLRMCNSEDSTMKPEKAWIFDSQPGIVLSDQNGESSVDLVMKAIQDIDGPVPSREWLYAHMKSKGFSLQLAQWLGSSLVGSSKGPLTWQFNPAGAREMYESYRSTDCLPILRCPPMGTSIFMVRAESSDRWNTDTIEELNFAAQESRDKSGSTNVLVLKNAGHWLHVDNPSGLMDLMLPSMS